MKSEHLVRLGLYYFSHFHLYADCAVTALAAGRVGDIIGRKGTLFSGAVVFTIGGAIQTWSTGYYLMIAGRVVSGLGVGLLSYVLSPERHFQVSSSDFEFVIVIRQMHCSYIPERDLTSEACASSWHHLLILYRSHDIERCTSMHRIHRKHHRIFILCCTLHTFLSTFIIRIHQSSIQWVDYFCSFIDSDLSWRIPLFIQCVIGFILAAGTLVIPESPRWLIDTDQEAEGLKVIADLHGGDPDHPVALAEFKEIKEKVLEDVSDGHSILVIW